MRVELLTKLCKLTGGKPNFVAFETVKSEFDNEKKLNDLLDVLKDAGLITGFAADNNPFYDIGVNDASFELLKSKME